VRKYKGRHCKSFSWYKPVLIVAVAVPLALFAVPLPRSTASADTALSGLELAQAMQANCYVQLAHATTSEQHDRAQNCIDDQQVIIDALTPPSPTPSGSTTLTPTGSSTPTPTPTVSSTLEPTTPPVTTPPPSPTTTPTPTPSPTGSPGPLECPPFPAIPDGACTGYVHTGVTLHECVPDGHLDVPNATYDSCHFPNGVVIQAANITITRSFVEGPVRLHWSMGTDYQGVHFTDVEIGGAWTDYSSIGIGSHLSCLRCDIHGNDSGAQLGNFNSLIDSWSHGFLKTGAHGAAASLGEGSGSHSVVVHNRLDCYRVTTDGGPLDPSGGCSAALALYDSLDDVLVQYNRFDSISGYCLYGGAPNGINLRILDNLFGNEWATDCGGAYGLYRSWCPDNAGNLWARNFSIDGREVVGVQGGDCA
jgi:hypothetical protein